MAQSSGLERLILDQQKTRMVLVKLSRWMERRKKKETKRERERRIEGERGEGLAAARRSLRPLLVLCRPFASLSLFSFLFLSLPFMHSLFHFLSRCSSIVSV